MSDISPLPIEAISDTQTQPPESTPARYPGKPKKPRKWRTRARTLTEYNPLDLDNLGRSVAEALTRCVPEPITDVEIMFGAGVYALYYTGDNSLYEAISNPDCEVPIYVGQARPQGTRKGVVDPAKQTCPLWDRIGEHRVSLEHAEGLDVADFKVRYLVAIEAFVSLAERALIRGHRPVWNRTVDGFGNHDPGANRRGDGARPPWDELHPGRWWSHPLHMPKPSTVAADESRARIAAHFAEDPEQLAAEEKDEPVSDDPDVDDDSETIDGLT
ncbi:Eco29kI family restriction endonuclease [Streptomyces sp. NPDC059477]|uniref:Eco29kI family restriction endonuclease n=1 Tax=Streptomyces sp. NPDC059477 TaxID=3346847 RepID=UPI00369A7FD1